MPQAPHCTRTRQEGLAAQFSGGRLHRVRSLRAGSLAATARLGDTGSVPDVTHSRCEVCGREASAWALVACPICAKVVCRKCGHYDFGRTFCSRECAILFFHGDDEDEMGREDL